MISCLGSSWEGSYRELSGYKKLSDIVTRYILRVVFFSSNITVVPAGHLSSAENFLDLATGQGFYIGVHRNRGEGEDEEGEDGKKRAVEMHDG